MHKGAEPVADNGPNSCEVTSGPARDLALRASPKVDVIFTADSHQQYNCSSPDPMGNPRVMMQGASHGRIVSVVDVSIDRTTRDVLRDRASAFNQVVTHDIPSDPDIQALADGAAAQASEIGAARVASLTGDLTRDETGSGESTLGNVVADAQLAAGVRARRPGGTHQPRWTPRGSAARPGRRRHLRAGLRRSTLRQHPRGPDGHRHDPEDCPGAAVPAARRRHDHGADPRAVEFADVHHESFGDCRRTHLGHPGERRRRRPRGHLPGGGQRVPRRRRRRLRRLPYPRRGGARGLRPRRVHGVSGDEFTGDAAEHRPDHRGRRQTPVRRRARSSGRATTCAVRPASTATNACRSCGR